MLKHYITYYPNTDKLKTFRQTWKDRNDLYEEYRIDGNLSLEQIWDGDIWSKWFYNENGYETYYKTSDGYWEKHEYDENDNLIYCQDSDGYWNKWEFN